MADARLQAAVIKLNSTGHSPQEFCPRLVTLTSAILFYIVSFTWQSHRIRYNCDAPRTFFGRGSIWLFDL